MRSVFCRLFYDFCASVTLGLDLGSWDNFYYHIFGSTSGALQVINSKVFPWVVKSQLRSERYTLLQSFHYFLSTYILCKLFAFLFYLYCVLIILFVQVSLLTSHFLMYFNFCLVFFYYPFIPKYLECLGLFVTILRI